MAKSKYFHVKHNTTGAEKLVKAARQSLAIQAVTGGKGSLRPAADEEIHQHLITGGTLHEKSCPEGEGKLFFLHADTPVLIRAKNATTAFQLLNDGSYSVEIAKQDALVRLITAGVTIIDADAEAGSQKTSSDADTKSGPDNSTDATTATVEGAAPAANEELDAETKADADSESAGPEASNESGEQVQAA